MQTAMRSPHADNAPLIEVRNLTKTYGDIRAVADLSFAVAPGTITGFLGPNGSGKSTTLRAVLGLIDPTQGCATIFGQAYRDLPDPLHVVGAMLTATTHPARTARSHLRVVATEARMSRRRVDELLELVELSAAADRRVGGFSLGMHQRLGLATALMGDPEVLILDEPANGLDPQGIRWLRDFLRALASAGRTILLSSHVLAEVAQTVEDVVVIDKGRLVAHESLATLVDGTQKGSVRVRCSDSAVLTTALQAAGMSVRDGGVGELVVTDATNEAIGQLAFDNSVVIYEIASITPNLEETFLSLTSVTRQGVPS